MKVGSSRVPAVVAVCHRRNASPFLLRKMFIQNKMLPMLLFVVFAFLEASSKEPPCFGGTCQLDAEGYHHRYLSNRKSITSLQSRNGAPKSSLRDRHIILIEDGGILYGPRYPKNHKQLLKSKINPKFCGTKDKAPRHHRNRHKDVELIDTKISKMHG